MLSRQSFLAAGLAGAFAGCQPSAEPTPVGPTPGDALLSLRSQYGVAAQVFTYNPQRIDIFRTAGGGALATGSQAFLDVASGSPVPGPLRLEVREVLTKADMVLSGRPSMSQGEVLESGGQYLVQATTAGYQTLRLSPRVKLGFATPVPAQLTSSYGTTLYSPDRPGSTDFEWVLATDTASSVQASTPLAVGDPVYFRCLIAKQLYDSNYGWLSFAHPIYSGYPRTVVRVRTNQPAADASNSAVYIVFRDYNAVAQLSAVGAGDFELANLPSTAAVTVFALHAAAGKLYLGQRQDTLRAGHTLTVTLAERRAAEVAAEAQRLQ